MSDLSDEDEDAEEDMEDEDMMHHHHYHSGMEDDEVSIWHPLNKARTNLNYSCHKQWLFRMKWMKTMAER